jgi:carbonic anhydrase
VSDPVTTPQTSWDEMTAGNARFVGGTPEHPHQDAARRAQTAGGQAPHAVLFGCSDSRLAAEIIFDRGLGDLFVVRNAGQVASDSVIGSIEYAVAVLKVPLLVVLAHDACGAVQAAIDSAQPDAAPLPPHIASLIAPIAPAVRDSTRHGEVHAPEVGRKHLENTVGALLEGSEILSAAVADGSLGIVGANYRLSEGRVEPHTVVGALSATA